MVAEETKPIKQRAAKGLFAKGNTVGKTGGRPAGVKQQAEAACAKHKLNIMEFFASVVVNENNKMRDRLDAGKELANRLFGKAEQSIDIKDSSISITIKKPDLPSCSIEE